jgi:hypothetical protein
MDSQRIPEIVILAEICAGHKADRESIKVVSHIFERIYIVQAAGLLRLTGRIVPGAVLGAIAADPPRGAKVLDCS